MLVVIAIIAILAAALFPAIQGAIEQSKATAFKNKGRGVWTAVVTANAEREPLGLQAVWPSIFPTNCSSTGYFVFLMNQGTSGSAICEDLKVGVFAGSGVTPAADVGSFTSINNAWCLLVDSNTLAETAFIFTKNISFGTTPPATVSGSTYPAIDTTRGVNIKRGVYVTYGGGCIDRRAKYIGVDQFDHQTNNLVGAGTSLTNLPLLWMP
jgi:type II secretory pathway pseudopilin PulG